MRSWSKQRQLVLATIHPQSLGVIPGFGFTCSHCQKQHLCVTGHGWDQNTPEIVQPTLHASPSLPQLASRCFRFPVINKATWNSLMVDCGAQFQSMRSVNQFDDDIDCRRRISIIYIAPNHTLKSSWSPSGNLDRQVSNPSRTVINS